MADMEPTDLDDDLKRLLERARKHDRSMAAELRAIVAEALAKPEPDSVAEFKQLAAVSRAMSAGPAQTPSEVLLREPECLNLYSYKRINSSLAKPNWISCSLLWTRRRYVGCRSSADECGARIGGSAQESGLRQSRGAAHGGAPMVTPEAGSCRGLGAVTRYSAATVGDS